MSTPSISVVNWGSAFSLASSLRQSYSVVQKRASACSVASCTPWERSATSSSEGQRVASIRRRSSASCSSGTSIRNGRMAVASAVACILALLGLADGGSLALSSARRAREPLVHSPVCAWSGPLATLLLPPGTSNEWHQIDTRPLRAPGPALASAEHGHADRPCRVSVSWPPLSQSPGRDSGRGPSSDCAFHAKEQRLGRRQRALLEWAPLGTSPAPAALRLATEWQAPNEETPATARVSCHRGARI